MMKTAIRLVAGIALLSSAAGLAAEEIELFPEGTFNADPRATTNKDDNTDAEAEALRSATYCDQYGPDYTLVPGTTTCIKATGHVQVDVYVGPGKRGGGRSRTGPKSPGSQSSDTAHRLRRMRRLSPGGRGYAALPAGTWACQVPHS